MSFSIGQVAEKLGISIDTIRYYDKEGVLPFVKRSENGRRVFTENDIHLMRTILCLKNAGVPVNEIAEFVQLRLEGDRTLEQRANLLKEHEANLQRQIDALQETMSYLKFKEWYYQTAVKAGTEQIHFVPNSTRVDPNLAHQYEKHLAKLDQQEELHRFTTVKDYRNRPTEWKG